MNYGGKGRAVLFAILILFYSIISSTPAHSKDIPDMELTIEIVLDKSAYNLSLSDEPVTFHGWVNYTGVSVIPITVHLEVHSDLGEVFLSQYNFTFRLPDSIPFNGSNPIEIELDWMATPQLTISGYVQQRGLQYEIPPSSCIIPVYYYEEEEGINDTIERKEEDLNLFLVGIPGYLLASLLFISLATWKTEKDKKKI